MNDQSIAIFSGTNKEIRYNICSDGKLMEQIAVEKKRYFDEKNHQYKMTVLNNRYKNIETLENILLGQKEYENLFDRNLDEMNRHHHQECFIKYLAGNGVEPNVNLLNNNLLSSHFLNYYKQKNLYGDTIADQEFSFFYGFDAAQNPLLFSLLKNADELQCFVDSNSHLNLKKIERKFLDVGGDISRGKFAAFLGANGVSIQNLSEIVHDKATVKNLNKKFKKLSEEFETDDGSLQEFIAGIVDNVNVNII